MFPRGPIDLKFGHASQRSDGLILDVLPRGPMELEFGHACIWTCLKFGRASQRSIEIEFGRASQRSDGLKFECAS